MEYVESESSQIEADAGFGDGFYGPETLGIHFLPPGSKPPRASRVFRSTTIANVVPPDAPGAHGRASPSAPTSTRTSRPTRSSTRTRRWKRTLISLGHRTVCLGRKWRVCR